MKLLVLAFVLSAAANTATTCAGLRSGRFVEANPLAPGTCAGAVALAAATVVPAALLAPRATGRTRTAMKVLLSVSVGTRSVAFVLDLRALRRRR